jgi:hypothetical protein
MAERALPAASVPRTVSVRVRTLVIAAIAIAVAIGIVWSLRWATGLRPISAGAFRVQPSGLTEAPGPHVGSPVYIVSGAKPRLVITAEVHNSASVPVTITGVDPLSGGGGPLTPLRLRPADVHSFLPTPGAFRALRIPADGDRAVTLVFGVVSGGVSCNEILSVGPIRFHVTVLGVFHDTQAVDLGDVSPAFAGAC